MSTTEIPFAAEGHMTPAALPMQPAAMAHDAASGEWRPLVTFTGTGWGLFRVWLVNVLLTIATLGLYHCWGKARLRSYIWKNTFFFGEPLEYTGTGGELFKGFLIVLPIVALISGIFFAVAVAAPQYASTTWPLSFVFFFFWQFASYRAIRYRLTRTRWRGIRNNLEGSALSYAGKALGYAAIASITLGLMLPWGKARLSNIIFSKVRIGNRLTTFTGKATDLYKAIVLFLVVIICLTLCLGFLLAAINIFAVLSAMTLPDFYRGDGQLVLVLVLFAVLLWVRFISFFYQFVVGRWTVNNLRFGGLRIRSTATMGSFFVLMLSNAFFLVASLGVALPWLYTRTLRYALNSLDYQGDPNLAELLQDTLPAPTTGEGFLDAFDVDIDIAL